VIITLSVVTTVDDIVRNCSDFYRKDEVFAAKALIEQVLTHRLPKRQGQNKCRATIDGLIKTCLDPKVTLPLHTMQLVLVDCRRLTVVKSLRRCLRYYRPVTL